MQRGAGDGAAQSIDAAANETLTTAGVAAATNVPVTTSAAAAATSVTDALAEASVDETLPILDDVAVPPPLDAPQEATNATVAVVAPKEGPKTKKNKSKEGAGKRQAVALLAD